MAVPSVRYTALCLPWRHNPDMPLAITPLLNAQGPVVMAIHARFDNTMAVYAVSSRVQGTTGPESDLDLAVLVARGTQLA